MNAPLINFQHKFSKSWVGRDNAGREEKIHQKLTAYDLNQ